MKVAQFLRLASIILVRRTRALIRIYTVEMVKIINKSHAIFMLFQVTIFPHHFYVTILIAIITMVTKIHHKFQHQQNKNKIITNKCDYYR